MNVAMDDDHNIVTDAAPTPQTLATLVGANLEQPNNFMTPQKLPKQEACSTVIKSPPTNNFIQNATSSCINLECSNNFQIGNNLTFNFSKSKNKKKKKNKMTVAKSYESTILPALLERSDLRVTTSKIKDVRIGEPWRFVMRHLGVTNPEIENKHEEYINKGGIEEVIYQLLRLWIEKNGSSATLDKLSRALLMENQKDALDSLYHAYTVAEPI
ncbi:protein immune deficiency [Neocloeon triangulifer]|uniref:protein immune deficiency n=1 Tax=Neocloeon triangulifer TaxID=2078957 RepID=UPI00286F8F13|nr:protein immune deficiency [Neocloeon triangulifer]